MALLYAQGGSLVFQELARRLASGEAGAPFFLAGMALVLVGIGFKLAAAPFHLWTPDVYQGAPAPVTGFIATVSKGGMLALLLRLYADLDGYGWPRLMAAIALMAIASMFLGNLLALLQTSVKRILAYSSIAHMGYMLVAFLAAGTLAAEAVTFYLVTYFVTTLGAFGVVTVCSSDDREAGTLADYRGLAWRRPWLAGGFVAMVLSLAGIPLTAGFIAKFYVFAAGVGNALWILIGVLVVTSIVRALFYYLRIIVMLFAAGRGWRAGAGRRDDSTARCGCTGRARGCAFLAGGLPGAADRDATPHGGESPVRFPPGGVRPVRPCAI